MKPAPTDSIEGDPARDRPLRLGSRRFWRNAGIAVALLALLWSAAWFYVPPIVSSQARAAAERSLGRTLTIGEVRFNPWTLELVLRDLVLAGAAAGAPPQLQVARVRADAAISSLWRFAPVIDAVDIDAPMLRLVRRADGRLDVDDVLERLAARPTAPDADSAPARFAVHNITVRGGSVDWTDEASGAVHRVRDLELGLPFLSSLASEREVKVEPHLAFALDGSRFDSSATATPFTARGSGEARLAFEHLDLAPYLGYLPASLPVQVRAGSLSADLRVAFEQRPRLSLRISGRVDLDGARVVDAASGRLAEIGQVRVEIDELRPFERIARLRRIDVDAPDVRAVRDAKGRINLLLAAADGAGGEVAAVAAAMPLPASSAASASASAPTSAANGWTFAIGELAVKAGRLDWRDATTLPAAALTVADFALVARTIGWPLQAPVEFSGSGQLRPAPAASAPAAAKPPGSEAASAARFRFSGSGDPSAVSVKVAVDAAPVAMAAPYLNGVVALPLAGVLSAEVEVDWKQGRGEPMLKIAGRTMTIAAMSLGAARDPELAARRVTVEGAAFDLGAKTLRVDRFALDAPRVRVERDRERHWNVERWQPPKATRDAAAAAAGSPAAPAAIASAAATSPGGWRVALGSVQITDGRASVRDLAAGTDPVAFDLSDVDLRLDGWGIDAARAALQLSARIAATRSSSATPRPAAAPGAGAGANTGGLVGKLDVRGELRRIAAGVPAAASLAIVARDLPMHAFDPYLDRVANVDVQRAQVGFKGDVTYEAQAAGPSLRARGDVSVDDLRVTADGSDRAAPRRALAMVGDGPGGGRRLLGWKALALRGLDLRVAPRAPVELDVAETVLSDVFARVLLDENGRLNLQDVVRGNDAPATAPASAPASSAAASPQPTPSKSPSPRIRFGPVTVAGGRVFFNDRFVKPNYTADLTELEGRLGGFSSEPAAPGASPALAELALTGRVEGTATLEIAGRVNPLARPLALDLKAKVRDLELPPLSPYSIKYAGYGIERGKLSVDLAYLVQPDGKLTASNRIVLNQLAFGDKVEGAPASLPVKLAVALLADSRGVIDLDLPIGGSINDPQFSVGGLVWQAIRNIVVKALTSPFSLLASAIGGGGSETKSTIEFVPGTAELTAPARAALDKIAAALAERPALSLTVSGESRLDAEREAWKQERLRQIVRGEKRRQAIAGGAAASAEVVVGDAEYPVLLVEVYRRADIATKPKNALGVTKEIPVAEMEALLLANIVVADDAMQQLAVRRGVAVRDYLATKQLPTSRLFLGSPKTSGAVDPAWTPRADLKLQAA